MRSKKLSLIYFILSHAKNYYTFYKLYDKNYYFFPHQDDFCGFGGTGGATAA